MSNTPLLLLLGLAAGCAGSGQKGMRFILDDPQASAHATWAVRDREVDWQGAVAESRGPSRLLALETAVFDDPDFDGQPDPGGRAFSWSQILTAPGPVDSIANDGEMTISSPVAPPWRLLVRARVQLDDGRWLEGSAPVIEPGPRLPSRAETLTVFGEPRSDIPQDAEARAGLETDLQRARDDAAARPDDALAQIWVGRRLGYLGRFREAYDAFSQVVERFPDDARGWRFRGHRAITLRRFDQAVADLTQAAALIAGLPDQVEPAGTPNERGIDLDTLHLNVYYHLALAQHLRGNDEAALDHWVTCLALARNDDGRAMATYWMCVALSLLDRHEDCALWLEPITEDMDIVEYHAYHQLCLAWKGTKDPAAVLATAEHGSVDEATIAYGVGVLRLARGEKEEALASLRLASNSPNWHAFGAIAAETELWRRGWTR